LIRSLTSKEIERKRLLVSKFKEDAINHIEIQEFMAILEKEKHIGEEEREKGGGGMLVFAISSLISHLSEYLKSQSEIQEEYVSSININIDTVGLFDALFMYSSGVCLITMNSHLPIFCLEIML
jgi:hypothetical protein